MIIQSLLCPKSATVSSERLQADEMSVKQGSERLRRRTETQVEDEELQNERTGVGR